jgi:hypothetical protein
MLSWWDQKAAHGKQWPSHKGMALACRDMALSYRDMPHKWRDMALPRQDTVRVVGMVRMAQVAHHVRPPCVPLEPQNIFIPPKL